MLRIKNVRLILYLGTAWIAISCATKRSVSVPPREIPPLETRIYRAPDVDWSDHSMFTLDLQEVGTPETSRNQILEKYLFTQAVQCLERKGYRLNEDDYEGRIRLYFGVKEERVSESETMLAYGVTGTSRSGPFLTQYSLASGLWRTAMVGATAWTKRTVHEAAYEGEITLEVFDREGKTQLWRGDIRAPLVNDDIRIASNWMIRELLWYFPTLDYPAVPVPEIGANELAQFWNSSIADREFYSPGQRHPVSFQQGNLSDTTTVSVDEARAEFAKTEAYKRIQVSLGLSHYGRIQGTSMYKQAFEEYLENVVERRNSQTRQTLEFLKCTRQFAAICDLLLTAPWSVKNESGTIFFAGRYFIGGDGEPTIIGIEAEPRIADILETPFADYVYSKYYITKIRTVSYPAFEEVWERSRVFREMVLGPIDLLPEQPTPAVRIEQGS